MNFRIRTAAFAVLAIAAIGATVARNAGARTVPRRAAKTWEVKMMTDMSTTPPGQKFDMKDITIQVGDTVKWIPSSGNHNVSFWEDSIPAGAAALIRKSFAADTIMVGAQGYFTLTTTRHSPTGNAAPIVVVFAGFPKGVYKYNCRPHLMRGMVGSITVQ